jgi:hypothetical protein
MATYGTHLRVHVLPKLGRRKIGSVTEDDIVALINELSGKGLSAWSVHGVLSPLSALFQFAIRRGWAHQGNPVRRLDRGERPKVDRKSRRILSGDEIGRLLAATPERYRLAVATAAYTGVRLGELLGLTWADVEFDAGLVHVRKQLGRDGVRVMPKTPGAVRAIVLMPQLEPLLKAHRERAFARGLDATERSGLRIGGWDAAVGTEPHRARLGDSGCRGGADTFEDGPEKGKGRGHGAGSPAEDAHAAPHVRVAPDPRPEAGRGAGVEADGARETVDHPGRLRRPVRPGPRHHDEIREAMEASAFGAVLGRPSS